MEKSVENLGVIEFLSSISKLHKEDAIKLNKILAGYRQLEKKYIKANQRDLYDNLEKEKRSILSYFERFENTDLVKINAFFKEASQNHILEDDSFYSSSPKRKINFIRLSYNKGSWNIEDASMKENISTKNIPEAIDLLTQVSNRDPQESAYDLAHTKELGEFYIASSSYSSGYDSDTYKNALETRYLDEPSIPQQTSEKTYVSGFDKPVSRQLASQEENIPESSIGVKEEDYKLDEVKEQGEINPEKDIRQGMTYLGKDTMIRTLTAVNDEKVITNLEEELSKDDVISKIKSGEWVLQAAKDEKENKKVTKIMSDISKISGDMESDAVLAAAVQDLATETLDNINKAVEKEREELAAKIDVVKPTIIKMANKAERVKLASEKTGKKLIKLKEALGEGFVLNYTPGVEKYSKKVKSVEEVEGIVEQMKQLIPPRHLSTFESLEEELYKWVSISEDLRVVVDRKNPAVMDRVKEKTEEIKKMIMDKKSSLKKVAVEIKDKAYIKANYLLENDLIDFEDYDTVSDLIEKDPIRATLEINSLYKIAKDNKIIKAGVIDSVKEGVMKLFNTIKEKLSYYLGFLSIQERNINEVDSLADEALSLIGEDAKEAK